MRVSDVLSRRQYLSVTADFSLAAWNTIATHEVFTVTGDVRLLILPRITESLVGAGLTIQLGIAGATTAWIAATAVAAMVLGTSWLDTTPAATDLFTALLDRIVMAGNDVGYEILVAAATDGTIVFEGFWEPLSPGSTVVAGTGVAL